MEAFRKQQEVKLGGARSSKMDLCSPPSVPVWSVSGGGGDLQGKYDSVYVPYDLSLHTLSIEYFALSKCL